jgi:hypothetical protein
MLSMNFYRSSSFLHHLMIPDMVRVSKRRLDTAASICRHHISSDAFKCLYLLKFATQILDANDEISDMLLPRPMSPSLSRLAMRRS